VKTWVEELLKQFGPERVITADAELLSHSYDAWSVAIKWRQQGKAPYRPDALFLPQSSQDVSRLLAWASENRIPVTPWGAGSSVIGAPLPMHAGISLDMSSMNRLLSLDISNLLVTVEAGMIGSTLEQELNSRGCTLNHSPQSIHRSTVGGWVATRAVGQFSSRWGGIEDLVASLTVVLPSGEIVKTLLSPRIGVGPDLQQLFMGSEGAFGVVTEVTLKIFPTSESQILESILFPSIHSGLEAMRRIIQCGIRPSVVRLYDADESRYLSGSPADSGNTLLLGLDGLPAVVQAEYAACLKICSAEGGVVSGENIARRWMERRFDFSRVESRLSQEGGVAETIEVAHFWDRIEATYHTLKKELSGLAEEVQCHFSHVYPQGTSLYIIILGQAENASQAEERLLVIWETAMRICLDRGASIAHHHGVGLARLPFIHDHLGPSYKLLKTIKSAFDPLNIMNPGKFGLDNAPDAREKPHKLS
jgi:alkyldihydroxyacetonephosphate synthase